MGEYERELTRRFNRAFRDVDRNDEFFRFVLGESRSAMNENLQTMRRLGLGMIIVSAIFVLIAQNSVVELSLGPVKVNKPSLALTALPVLLSYLWFRWVGHEVDYGAHLNAYNCMIRSKMPDFDDVSEFLLPVASISGRSMRSQRRPLGSPAEAAAFYLAAIIEITVLYWLPLLGTIAMYVFLYVSEGSSPLLIISTIISGFVTAAALAQRKW